jgi:hypothetical protein
MAETLAKNVDVEELWRGKCPASLEPWVGIEIEFYTFFPHLPRMLANSSIAPYIALGEDGSIEVDVDDECTEAEQDGLANGDKEAFVYEMKICAPEKRIREVVGKACSILRYAKARTNSTCGLHIHLDHRVCVDRNPVRTFNNLMRLQDVLFDVTDEDRRDNEYCTPVPDSFTFYNHIFHQMSESDYDEDSRYYSINLIALRDTETIEVRLFSGTIKFREIMHYLSLTLGAVRNDRVKEKITKNNVDIVKAIPYSTRNFVRNKIRKAA